MSDERYRLFVAVDPAERTRRRLAKILEALKGGVGRAGWKARFPKAEDLHLTLKFLGSVPADRVPEIGAALRPIASTDRFEIAFEGVGAFPTIARPRILWVGVTEGAERLKALAEQVDRCCQDLGFEPEGREFKPHLTLARLKWARGSASSVVESVSPREAGSSLITEITLYRSELGQGGPRYTPLVRIPLGATETSNPKD